MRRQSEGLRVRQADGRPQVLHRLRPPRAPARRKARPYRNGGISMASARITQTIHADGSVTTTMTVTCDVLDSHETVEESVKNTGVLWFVTQSEDEDDTF